MDVLKFLKSIRSKRAEITTLKRARDELYWSLMPSGIRYDLDKVQTSPQDRMSETAGDLYEIQDKLDHMIAALASDVNLAVDLVSQMPTPECRQLITLRYLGTDRELSTWESVAQDMGYTPEYVRGELHGKAIKEARTVWTKDLTESYKPTVI